MAPSVAEMLDQELATGTLEVVPGQMVQVKTKTKLEAEVCIRTKWGEETIAANRVINCTGPSLDYRAADSPLLQSLFAQGLIMAGPPRSGLCCDLSGALVSTNGEASQLLFTLGPGRQGILFESLAIPEIAQQAADLANLIVRNLAH